MKRIISAMVTLAAGFVPAPASAGILDVSAVVSSAPDGPNFDYKIVLTNSSSSTDSLETFWFAWVPGKDFMPTNPVSVTPPAGWTDNITNGGPTDGFAIQFLTTTAALAPGNALTFAFTSADTPAQIAGNSPFYPGTPVGTSFVYQNGPFSGDSDVFQVSAVPEPSSLVMSVIGGVALLRTARRRRRPAV